MENFAQKLAVCWPLEWNKPTGGTALGVNPTLFSMKACFVNISLAVSQQAPTFFQKCLHFLNIFCEPSARGKKTQPVPLQPYVYWQGIAHGKQNEVLQSVLQSDQSSDRAAVAPGGECGRG